MPALLCIVIFLCCLLLVNPRVNSGILDDWSIARSAQLLAQTGHVHYNGWEAPILGWQLYAGALFIKLFGFSFTVLRSVNMLEALITVALAQRLFVRAGIREWNAAFGALTLALCPVFFTSSVLFMTDIPGTLAVLVCLYGCVRAVQAMDDRSSAGWLIAAALLNALLGATRQIAWLGLLVMVPCALWLLRRRRSVVLAGAAAWVCGIGVMLAVLHWFKHQPYILPEHLLYPGMTVRRSVGPALRTLCRVSLDLLLVTFPLTWAFLPQVQLDRRTLRVVALTAIALAAVVLFLYGWKAHHDVLAPFLLTPPGFPAPETMVLSYPTPILGPTLGNLTLGFRLVLTAVDFVSVLAVIASLVTRRTPVAPRQGLSSYPLLVLLVPFSIAYFALLLPRAIQFFTVERYLMFFLPIVIFLLLHLYERTDPSRIGAFGIVPLCIVGLYTTCLLHDLFAIHRANLAAVDELRAAGVPRDRINGGLEYNSTTQLLGSDFVPTWGVQMPDGHLLTAPTPIPYGPCSQVDLELTPLVHPVFGVGYPSAPCAKISGFAPVPFTTWLAPHHRTAVVIRYGEPHTPMHQAR